MPGNGVSTKVSLLRMVIGIEILMFFSISIAWCYSGNWKDTNITTKSLLITSVCITERVLSPPGPTKSILMYTCMTVHIADLSTLKCPK